MSHHVRPSSDHVNSLHLGKAQNVWAKHVHRVPLTQRRPKKLSFGPCQYIGKKRYVIAQYNTHRTVYNKKTFCCYNETL